MMELYYDPVENQIKTRPQYYFTPEETTLIMEEIQKGKSRNWDDLHKKHFSHISIMQLLKYVATIKGAMSASRRTRKDKI